MPYYNKNLQTGKIIQEIIKRYYLTFFGQFFLAFSLILLPFFLLYLLFQWKKLGIIIFLILLITGIILFLRFLMNYHFNRLIITNQRLIYYRQKGFFHRTVFAVFLEKIQDVSYEINGFWQTIFKYGTLDIQVIKSPAEIQNLINRIKNNFSLIKNEIKS